MTDTKPATFDARLAIVAVFALITALAGTWSLPPLDRDEARFAQATAQMLESGDLVTIRFQETERNKKPAGIYWLQAASVSAVSDVKKREIWPYRIPSIIGGVLAAIFTYLAAATLYDKKTALLAGVLLASAPVVAAESTIAKTDGMLLALICLAQLSFLHTFKSTQNQKPTGWRQPVTFWLAQGAAALIKGPIAPLVSLLTGVGLAISTRSMSWLKPMRPVAGTLIFILMTVPWLIAIGVATEGRFFTDAIGGDMLGKVGDAQEGHSGPPGYHTLLTLPLFWPAAALIIPGLLLAWRERDTWQAKFLLSWALPAWIMFELSATKLPHYTMPLYPALAIMAAHAATTGIANLWMRRANALIYLAIGCVAGGLIVALPFDLAGSANLTGYFMMAGAFLVASAIVSLLFWKGRAVQGGLTASVLACLFAWTVMNGVLPALNELSVSPQLSEALYQNNRHPLRNGAQPVALVGYNEPSAIFLLGTETILSNPDDAARLLKGGAVNTAVIEQRYQADFLAYLGDAPATTLAEIKGLNYSNGDDVSLTLYVLAPDAE